MKKIVIISIFITFSFSVYAQDHAYNKDSVFQIIKSGMKADDAAAFEKAYNVTNDQGKHFLLSMYSLPKSSFNDQLDNLNERESEILELEKEFKKMVPKNFRIYVEFQEENVVYNQKGGIIIGISKKNSDGLYPDMTIYKDLAPDSKELQTVLKTVKWNTKKINEVKKLLDNANCISIGNGERTSIGFARNSLGKLWYIVFPTKKLTTADMRELAANKNYTYYRNNIVFKQDGGDLGPIKFNPQ